ncbi:MAG TPA: flagellar hook protein FlgE [Thermoanaerobacterales bacterium]|nr:flagellar hook protein FlgE [Thermoanaerobacterales bacterium]
MMRSMFAGVSGLRNHQIRMDVIGNNIANVNTIGFKKSRVTFQEMLNQTMRGASSPQSNRGGTNPQQVGLGVAIAGIDTIHTDGGPQPTGQMTDLAIEGDGFFIVRDGRSEYYTRAGNFNFDAEGNLVNPANGMKVMGWVGDVDRIAENLSSIIITKGQPMAAKSTTQIIYRNNLDADTPDGDTYKVPMKVFDSLGRSHTVNVEFKKEDTTANKWSYSVINPLNPDDPTDAISSGTLIFDSTGALDIDGSTIDSFSFTPDGAAAVEITPDFSAVTQVAQETSIVAHSQDGYPAGSLRTITIDTMGTITGIFTNGINEELAQIALITFDNPGGLLKSGDNLYQNSNNSGEGRIGPPATGGRGIISPGSLEMSNVDLSEEFTQMIITQRGFQANSRIITTSDEMLQELVNIKR